MTNMLGMSGMEMQIQPRASIALCEEDLAAAKEDLEMAMSCLETAFLYMRNAHEARYYSVTLTGNVEEKLKEVARQTRKVWAIQHDLEKLYQLLP